MPGSMLDFVIFCIEEVATKLQLPGNVVYDLLTKKSDILFVYDLLTKKSDILSGYIVPSYDVLHTQSKQYIVDDIISLMREEGLVA